MKTNVLMAVLGTLLGHTKSPYEYHGERRTVKVRPANYTHPMIVSSPAEITAWNGRVALAKQDRNMQRARTRRRLIDVLLDVASELPGKDGTNGEKKTAYLRKALTERSLAV